MKCSSAALIIIWAGPTLASCGAPPNLAKTNPGALPSIRFKTDGTLRSIAPAVGRIRQAPPRPPPRVKEAAIAASLQQRAPGQRNGYVGAPEASAPRTITNATLSDNGEWFAYVLSSVADGQPSLSSHRENELILRSLKSGREMRLPTGIRGGQFAFTRNSRWFAYVQELKTDETTRFHHAENPAPSTLIVLDLRTGTQEKIEGVRSFVLDGFRSRTLVLEPYSEPASGNTASQKVGRDLVLYDRVEGAQVNLPSVGEFAFDASGRWLAWTVATIDQMRSSLWVRDMERGADRVLDSGQAMYRSLRWADDSRGRLAVLKGTDDPASTDTIYQLLGYTGFARGAPKGFAFEPQPDTTLPTRMTIDARYPLRWSEDHEAIFLGIRAIRLKSLPAPQSQGEHANLVLWHWNDPQLQSEQHPQLQSEQHNEKGRNETNTFLSVYHLKEMKLVRLADDFITDVVVAPHDRWALGWDSRTYAMDENWQPGRYHVDLHAIDVKTGAKRLLVKRYLLTFGMKSQQPNRFFLSPDGVHVLTWANSSYTVHDMATGEARPLLSEDGPSFGEQPHDYSPHYVSISPTAWSQDGETVILSDGWDLWAVPLNGDTPVNLTVDGKKVGIKYRWLADGLMRSNSHLDLSKSWYVVAASHWTKETGIVRIDGRKPGAHRVLWGEASFLATRARGADVVVFTRETAVDYPDYFITDLTFANPRRITDANQQKELRWSSGTMLVDYQGPSGERLQASLLLPASYEKGQQYPAIVQVYERGSYNRHKYKPSDDGTSVDPALYASRGYVIIFPDINYEERRPGTSALHCVLAAARAAAAAGVVDSTRVGVAGHSFGGYETAFIVTQTPFFKAALVAAPVTNLVSAYGGIYWDRGTMNAEIFEADQLRMAKPYWQALGAYVRESPVFHVDRVKTPILLVHNDRDGAVDWRQGIEFYNVLRRARKPVVMLQYVGEEHEVSRPANRQDFARRGQEFFDHFLLGAPAPKWWISGVP